MIFILLTILYVVYILHCHTFYLITAWHNVFIIQFIAMCLCDIVTLETLIEQYFYPYLWMSSNYVLYEFVFAK
jgi:hypothetical protein